MDIKFTDTGDLDFSTGDLRLVEPEQQHQFSLLLSGQGELKMKPDLGVDAANYLLDNQPGDLLREARRHCIRAGMNIRRVYFENNAIKLEGGYQ